MHDSVFRGCVWGWVWGRLWRIKTGGIATCFVQKREPERTRSRIDKGYVESIVGDADANNSNPNRDRASASTVYLNETMATTVHSEVSKRKSRKSESQIKKQSGLIDLVVSKQKKLEIYRRKRFSSMDIAIYSVLPALLILDSPQRLAPSIFISRNLVRVRYMEL